MFENLHGLGGEELALLGSSEGTLKERIFNAISHIEGWVYVGDVGLLGDIQL